MAHSCIPSGLRITCSVMYCSTPGTYTNGYFVCVYPFCLLENRGVSECYGVFPLPDSDSETYSETDSDSMQKGYTGTDSDGDSYAKSQWKCMGCIPYRYWYWCQNGYSSHWNRNQYMHRSLNRFSGNTSAHYYYSHFHRNRNRSRHRNRSRAVETHHYTGSHPEYSDMVTDWYKSQVRSDEIFRCEINFIYFHENDKFQVPKSFLICSWGSWTCHWCSRGFTKDLCY